MTGHDHETTEHAGPSDLSGGARIDTTTPHPARMYDWFLGGKDNYPVDVEMGKQLVAMEPRTMVMARANRAFMERGIRWLAKQGVRQFLDIGTGIPTEPNLHQIAQRVTPEARVVYCDNDPIVLRHAEALLRSTPEGVTEYVQADAREPQSIVEQARKVLDFTEPVALSLIALLHFVSDEQGAHELVRRLMDELPSGSYLMLSHATGEFAPDTANTATDMYRARGLTLALRDRDEVARFFDGLELVEPGVEVVTHWRPELGETGLPADESDDSDDSDAPIPGFVGVGRKP
ncbi:SAM-dependent methyltransferase [Streptomyces boluensis]|uniref:SAM-dependent methyltransferase n=1 Tax=Streptomyces boluensis TaxID=1775135 RepID=A0A964XLV7_9ACTN|nr:SAM-dependent methyltransferase [Streptomyces boluensis]NBE53740.1 SAM-dependent methyltransferase [Streptomyces boluensis]